MGFNRAYCAAAVYSVSVVVSSVWWLRVASFDCMYELIPEVVLKVQYPATLATAALLAHLLAVRRLHIRVSPACTWQHSYPSSTPTPRSLNLQVPALHSSDLLIDSFLQGFDRFVHADMSTPRIHGET
jgi:hypothetical protein